MMLPALACVFTVASPAFAAEAGWTVDFAAAKAAAVKNKKDLLLEFTGSDWCPPCKILKAEVFDKDEFKKAAPQAFVLVKLDYPRDKTHQTEAEIAQNDELQKRYAISAFPTVILTDAQGRPYAKTAGYGGQTAKEYVKLMMDSRKVRQRRDAAFAEAAKATGVEAAKALDKGLAGIDEDLVTTIYKPEVDRIIAADADGAAGLKGKYIGLLTLKEAVRALEDIQQVEDDIPARLKLVDDLVARLSLTGQALQEAHFTKAIITYRDNPATARKHMEAAIEAAPATRKADEIRQIIKQAYAEKKDEK